MPSSRSTIGLPPGVHLGPTGPRLLAAVVEVGPVWVMTGLAVLFGFVLNGRLVGLLSLMLALAWAILVWAQRAARAAGPGMRLDGLQLVGFNDGRPIGWGRVLLRWLVFAGLTITVVGLIALVIVMARHPRRQGWHDLAANAVVIKERPLAPPRPKQAVARTATRAGSSAPSAPAGPARPATAATTPESTTASAPEPVAAGGVDSTTDVVVAESAAAMSPASPEADDEVARATDDHARVADRPEPEWRLRLDDGRDVGVDTLVLIGRNPQPRVGEEDATLVKVSDETRTVSKSHLAVGVDASGLYVMDRGSTNGTTVTAPDGGQRPCAPGDLVDVPGGSVISFGDHWLEVRRTATDSLP